MISFSDTPPRKNRLLDRAYFCFVFASMPQYAYEKADLEVASWRWLFLWAGMPE